MARKRYPRFVCTSRTHAKCSQCRTLEEKSRKKLADNWNGIASNAFNAHTGSSSCWSRHEYSSQLMRWKDLQCHRIVQHLWTGDFDDCFFSYVILLQYTIRRCDEQFTTLRVPAYAPEWIISILFLHQKANLMWVPGIFNVNVNRFQCVGCGTAYDERTVFKTDCKYFRSRIPFNFVCHRNKIHRLHELQVFLKIERSPTKTANNSQQVGAINRNECHLLDTRRNSQRKCQWMIDLAPNNSRPGYLHRNSCSIFSVVHSTQIRFGAYRACRHSTKLSNENNKKWQLEALDSSCHTFILRSLFEEGCPHIFVECLKLAANKFVPSSMHSSIDSLSSKRFSMWLILNSTPCSTKIHANWMRKRFRRNEFYSLPWHIGQATLHWKQSHRKCFLRILSRRRFASTFDTLVRWIFDKQ